jgi:CAAX protease family protein
MRLSQSYEGTMITFIRKHSMATYFVLTFAISWGAAFLAVGGTGGMQGTTPASDPRFAYALIAMLAGPSLSGLLLTALVCGGAGLRQYLSRLLKWRVDAASYTVAILIAPVVMTATLLVLSIASPAFIPGIVTSDQKAFLLVVSLAVGLSAGVFEELGWTGFAIPTLRQRHGVLATGLIVGIWWSAWHLFPLIWASHAASGDLSMPVYLAATIAGVFVGYLTAFRVLMVWIYERTKSIFLGMLMHVSITASLLMLNPLGISGGNLQLYSFALAAATWVAVAVISVGMRRQSRHRFLGRAA